MYYRAKDSDALRIKGLALEGLFPEQTISFLETSSLTPEALSLFELVNRQDPHVHRPRHVGRARAKVPQYCFELPGTDEVSFVWLLEFMKADNLLEAAIVVVPIAGIEPVHYSNVWSDDRDWIPWEIEWISYKPN